MGTNARTENVVKNTFSGVLQRVVALLSNFVIQIIFVRLLGLQYVGIASLFTSLIALLSLAELGISNAIIYNLYKPIAKNDMKKISAYANYYAKAYNIIAVVILAIGLCLMPFIDFFIKGVPDVQENIKLIYFLFLLDTAVSYLLIYKSTIIIAAQKQRIISNIQTFFCIVKCGALVIILLFWKSYYAFLVTTVLITFTQNFLISQKANKLFPCLKDKKEKLSNDEKSSLIKDVKAMFLYKISGVILHSTDNILISKFIGTSVVGQTANYNLFTNNIYNFVLQFFSATSSGVGDLAVEKDEKHEHEIFNTLNFIAFWIFAFCGISLFVVLQPAVILFFGKESLLPIYVILALVADFYVKGMMSPITSFRTAHGLFVQGKYRPLIMAILNIILSVLLMKWIGLVGIFVATVISRLVTQVWYDPYIIYKHVFKSKPYEYFKKYIIWFGFTCLVGGLTWYIASLVTPESIIIDMLFKAVICVLVPNILMVLFFHKTEEFKKTASIILQLLKNIKSRLKRGNTAK